MKRAFLLIVILLFVLFAGSIWLSPYFTMVDIRDAVSDKDAEKLRDKVEFPTVRQNFKAQLNGAIFKKAAPDLKDKPFSAMGKMIGSKMVDLLTDAIVTPEAAIAFIHNSDKFQEFKDQSAGFLGDAIAIWQKGRSRYDSFSTFSYWPPIEDAEIRLVFSRSGLGWKLTNVGLPADLLENIFKGETNKMEKSGRKP
jgi:hypothetical protein